MDRLIQFYWDRMSPEPSDSGPVWCLGRKYPGHADKWDPDFLSDVQQQIWLMYRTGFAPIARDPDGPSPLRLSSVLRTGQIDTSAFSTDVGWGCMIRTGQSVLANALLALPLTDQDKVGESTTTNTESTAEANNDAPASVAETGSIHNERPENSKRAQKELKILRLFADEPDAVLSVHKFVEHGALHCGKRPGEWFGPSAVASCIRALTEPLAPELRLNVYISAGMDVYEDQLEARLEQGAVLVLCGLRLGINSVNPVYYDGLKAMLTAPQSVGIAGGRTSASHYFYGFQGERLFFHDPHEPKPALHADTPAEEILASVHSERLRALPFAEMDPSMLAGFLIKDTDDLRSWKQHLETVDVKSRTILIHERTPPSPALSSSSTEPESELQDGFVLCDPPASPQGQSSSGSGAVWESKMSDAVMLDAKDTSVSQEHEEEIRAPRPTEEEDVLLGQDLSSQDS